MNFDYYIETRQNDLLYWGRLNTVFVKSEFLENEQINYGVEVKPLNNCTVKGIYPTVDIIPIDRPICSIQVYYQTELKLTKHFIVTDIPNPSLTSEELRDWDNERTTNLDEVIQSEVSLVDFQKIKKVQAKVIAHDGNQAIGFHLTQFNFSVLRKREIVFEVPNNGEMLSKDIRDFMDKIQPGDRIIIENIICHLNEYENERRIDKKYNYNIVTIK
jgi:hypothetical protein